MIEAAEAAGLLRPGGTIVEPTSGNTGVGLAMVAAARGYRCIFVMADKQSPEKIQLLRALGAEVVVCPTDVEPEDPRSYYSVSRRLAEETPNAFNPNQYANQANPATHYATTGPEIWEQVGDDLDYLVVGVGTGGTVTGVGRYLKEQKPDDPDRRRRSRGLDLHRRGALVPDRGRRRGLLADDVRSLASSIAGCRSPTATPSCARVASRRVEGILIGGSGGMAVQAALTVAAELTPDKTVLVILPDGGRPYLSKVFDDDWMRSHGLLDRPGLPPTVADLMRAKSSETPGRAVDRHDRGRRARLRGDRPAAALRHLAAAGARRGRRRGRGERRAASSARSRSARCSTASSARAATCSTRPVEELMSPPLEIVDVLRAARRRVRRAAVEPRARDRRRAPPGGRRPDAHRPARVPRPPPRVALLEVSLEAARRLVVARAGFRSRRREATLAELAATIERLGCVQIDAISTVDRSQRLVLASAHRPRARRRAEPAAALGARVRVLGARGVPDARLRLAVLPRAHARPSPPPLVRDRARPAARAGRAHPRDRRRGGPGLVPQLRRCRHRLLELDATRSARSTRSGRPDSWSSPAARASSGSTTCPRGCCRRAVLEAPAPVGRGAPALPDHALACARAA